MDDHSRLAYSQVVLDDDRSSTVAALISWAIVFFELSAITVEAEMTDNGVRYRSRVCNQVLTDAGVKQCLTWPHRTPWAARTGGTTAL